MKPVIKIRGEIDPADKIPMDELWIIKSNGVVKRIDFRCPCGCGSECYTPVSPQPNDRTWTFDESTNTLTPSIRFTGGCKAHFNITNGQAVLHGDSGK